MPYVEVTTSKQDWSVDADGYAQVSRTFFVWKVNPDTFWTQIDSIPHRDLTNNTKMPLGGTTITGTPPIMNYKGASGEALSLQSAMDMTLYKYELGAVSAIGFNAIARYTNDPRLVPTGATYSETSQYSIVQIPVVRKVLNIGSSSSTTQVYAHLEDYINAYMPVRRLSASVPLHRKRRREVQRTVDAWSGRLVSLPGVGIVRYEGADVRTRGPLLFDVTYNFTQEMGIKTYDDLIMVESGSTVTVPQLRASYIMPKGAPYLQTGSNTPWFLPPYHTIKIVYPYTTSANIPPRPQWLYRLNGAPIVENEYFQPPGSEMFEWNVVPI